MQSHDFLKWVQTASLVSISMRKKNNTNYSIFFFIYSSTLNLCESIECTSNSDQKCVYKSEARIIYIPACACLMYTVVSIICLSAFGSRARAKRSSRHITYISRLWAMLPRAHDSTFLICLNWVRLDSIVCVYARLVLSFEVCVCVFFFYSSVSFSAHIKL